jgi:type-F conjugative transfer system secretin TraK
MNKFKLTTLTCLCLLCFTKATALQIKPGKDNETIYFKIAAKEYSRIFVKGDRILTVKGKSIAYQLKEFKGKSEEGILYIQPTESYQNRPFTLFVGTEQGHHYTLLLESLNIPAENIEIKPLSASKALATRWEENQPYLQKLIELMRQMKIEDQPEGYAIVNMGIVKPKKFPNGISLQLLTLYKGGQLDGEVWKLKNESGRTLEISPRQFYQNNVRAISVVEENLKNCEETIMYRIVSHD